MSKLREATRQTMGITRRAQEALKAGLKLNGDQWASVAVPAVSDAEVDQFMQDRFGIPGRSSKSNTGTGGEWQTINGVRARRKQ
jgi:hypothetical protein